MSYLFKITDYNNDNLDRTAEELRGQILLLLESHYFNISFDVEVLDADIELVEALLLVHKDKS